MKKRRVRGRSGLLAGLAAVTISATWLGNAIADGWNPGSTAPNEPNAITGGISNTRHNLTMSYSTAQGVMGPLRNNYFEVCVYCHTPHGANSTAAAPLWNRTVTERSYTLYDNSASMTGGKMSQPGPNSLTCLSCHDGVTAIDSVINMPTQVGGSYRAGYSKNQESSVDFEFLNAWGASGNNLFDRVDKNGDPLLVPQPDPNTSVDRPNNGAGRGHSSLASFGDSAAACISCHAPSQSQGSGLAPSFLPFLIGRNTKRSGILDAPVAVTIGNNDVDVELQEVKQYSGPNFLSDDHPIGVQYPKEFGIGSGFNEPDHMKPRIAFFDSNNNNHADPNEVRLYDTGEGYEVECGSCHDPHGVKVSDEDDAPFIPSFLRVGASSLTDSTANLIKLPSESFQDANVRVTANAGSKLCLTCHVK